MKNRWQMIGKGLVVAVLVAAGCGPSEKTTTTTAKPKAKKLYMVQFMKGHPVHQLTQVAFQEGCRKYGYACEIVGTDGPDIAGTVALAEQVLAKSDCAGMLIWAPSPSFYPLIERVGKAGIPVILPHFPIAEGSAPGATGIIGCDPAAYAREAAQEIGKAIAGKGTVIITQGSFNTTENAVTEAFTKAMKEFYPDVRVLKPEEEGFDAPKAISKAVSLLQANPDAVAALSTTGGGPTTWAGAQKETGRKIIAVGMDYTRVNLDLVKEGRVYAVVGQPLWEESYGTVELLDKAIRGEKIPWWTRLPAPFITKDKLAPYNELLDKVEAALKK
jgi:ribose transport system substrate-binding protein